MSETRIIEKDSEMIYSVFADAKLEERDVVVGYHLETKTWHVDTIASWCRWKNFTFKDYKLNESLEIPPEIIEEMKQKQEEFDRIFQTKDS